MFSFRKDFGGNDTKQIEIPWSRWDWASHLWLDHRNSWQEEYLGHNLSAGNPVPRESLEMRGQYLEMQHLIPVVPLIFNLPRINTWINNSLLLPGLLAEEVNQLI